MNGRTYANMCAHVAALHASTALREPFAPARAYHAAYLGELTM